jgi:hypothetical protein
MSKFIVNNDCDKGSMDSQHHFLIAMLNGNYSKHINLIEFDHKFVFNKSKDNYKDGMYTFHNQNA